MAALAAAIHAFARFDYSLRRITAWMPDSRPGMTRGEMERVWAHIRLPGRTLSPRAIIGDVAPAPP